MSFLKKYFTSISFSKFYIILVLLFPSFFGYLGLNKGQLFYLLITILVAFLHLFFYFGFYKNVKVSKINIFFILAFIAIFVEYSISMILNFESTSLASGDIIEIFRPIIYCLCYLFSVFITKNLIVETGTFNTLKFFENVIFYSSFIEWFKFIRIFIPFFKLYTIFPYGSINFVRFSGFTGFAYNYAWILCITLFINMYLNRKINFRFLYYSFLIILTGSRTGFLSLMFMYFIMFVYFKKIRFSMGITLFFLSIIIFFLYIIEVDFIVTSVDYIIRLVLTVLGKAKDGSALTRANQNASAINAFNCSPLFGIASDKTNNIVIENFYFHHLRNWGLLGLSLYIITLLFFYFLTPKKYSLITKAILISGFLICCSTPLFDQVRNFNILYLLFAILMTETKIKGRS